MNALEEKIALKFNAKEAFYTGSGTSALYLIFKYLKQSKKDKILIPSLVCPQVACAAIKADCKVEFVDANLNDYTISLEDCIKIYNKNPFDVLVLVHIYGHFCDERIIQFCREKNIFIIEDSAQTYKINPKCDLSVLSFGHTKFLENPLWGGVVFSSKISLDEFRNLNKSLNLKACDFRLKYEKYRKDYYSLNQKDKDFFEKLQNLLLDNTFFFSADFNPYIEEKLSNLNQICQERKEKMQIYQNLLKSSLIIHPVLSKDAIPWRYTFRYLGDRDKLLKKLREKGIDCSSWYLPSNLIFTKQRQENSELLSKQLINLWLDEKISKEKIQKDIKIILNLL